MRWGMLATLLALSACAADHNQACLGYGFKPGTDGFANCLMQQDLADRAMWWGTSVPAPTPVLVPMPVVR